MIIYKFIGANIKPIAVVIIATCVGFLFGHALTGFVIGLLIISLVTLFL
jgi:hypothetical protein